MNRSIRGGCGNGYALLEVLVTLVILLIGLLGLAGVNARANVTEMESYQRVQALALLQDMVDRLNANRMAAPCYSNGTTGVQVGTGYSGTPTCTLGTDIIGNVVTGNQQNLAISDLQAWNTQLLGSAEVKGGSKIGAMIGAVGCVRQIDAINNIYLVSVSWQGLADTVAPTDATGTTCGNGSYGAETKHRMVTATVQIATLYVP
jgi:type IV pilus assembly protein PilV